MMWKLLVMLALCFLIVGVNAVPVNFTEWSAYGDSWKANNDTHTLLKWNATGTHTWLTTGNTSSVIYLVVAGGGGGGTGDAAGGGGGGGAGGLLTGINGTISGSIPITVGFGGAPGANGTNSTFGNIVVMGGGAGGPTAGSAGRNGGSGGGGSNPGGVAGLGAAGQGSNGGASGSGNGGGGGGATSAGLGGSGTGGGVMGNGTFSTITGSSVCYSEGGGGGFGSYTGLCGGGRGATSVPATSGLNGTGSGGGGNYNSKGAGIGGSGVVIISYLTPVPTPPIASFTCTPTSTTLGTPISCTDTSSDTPTNWTYYWGDGNVTDGTQNPSYTYPFTGTFSINQTVNNTLGGSWYNRSNYITITNVTSFTQQDIYLTGQYTITFNVKSSTTNLPIANVTVVDAVSGQSYHTTDGTAYLTEPAGLIYVNFIADGYQSRQITYAIDEDATKTVKLTPSAPSPGNSPVPVYIPQQVRIRLVDFEGDYLSGVMVTATPVNFTAPANWTEILFGISPGVNITGSSVTGITGTDGSWVAPMLQSIQYNVSFTRDPDISYIVTLYPQQSEYVYTIPLGIMPITTPSNIITYSLSNATIDATHQYVNMTYTDSSGGTDYLQFAVFDTNNTMIHSANYTGTAANSQVYSQVVTCPKGTGTSYVINANQSQYGWINQSATIRLDTQVDLMLNGGPEWVKQWVAIGLIIIIGTLFSIFTRKYAGIAIGTAIFAFQYIFFWLPANWVSNIALLSIFGVGALIYIRESENKIQ